MTTKAHVAGSCMGILLEAYRDLEQPNLKVEDLLLDLKTHRMHGTWMIDIEKAFVAGYRQGIIDAKASEILSKLISPDD